MSSWHSPDLDLIADHTMMRFAEIAEPGHERKLKHVPRIARSTLELARNTGRLRVLPNAPSRTLGMYLKDYLLDPSTVKPGTGRQIKAKPNGEKV